MKHNLLVLLGLIALSFSCKMDKKVDRSAYEEELKDREIVRVSEAEIFEAAMKLGGQIADETQKTLGSQLQQAVKSDGVPGAIQYCNLQAYPLVDSLQQKYAASIKRVTSKPRNPDNAPDSLEQVIFDAYQYNHENGQPLAENLQAVGKDTYLYNKPIMIGNPLCLACHGPVGEGITKEHYEVIKELYPHDQAINYKMGELRGMWSIRLSKKELIRNSFQ